ncbi:hypothetical protein [Paracidovorax avenae]|uniref:hypothetical protein n=1 Tax=Paracidovorax avenae TaxID=80867 RepID=UPI001CEF6D8B|nr:hypothetical protein [Paracidovorax avenae]
MRERVRAASLAASIHLGSGLILAVLLAILIFVIWFPYPYYEISNGRNLFLTLILVDMVCGPLLTLLLYSPFKARWKWRLDLAMIIFMQLGAMLYGLEKISQSRPVFLAYEGDRFRVVQAADVDSHLLNGAQSQFSNLSWRGPSLIGTKLLSSSDPGYLESLRLALEGNPPSFRPERWVDYGTQKEQLLNALKPMERLMLRPGVENLVNALQRSTGLPSSALGYLPLVQGVRSDWTVVVSREDGMPKAFWHVDGW